MRPANIWFKYESFFLWKKNSVKKWPWRNIFHIWRTTFIWRLYCSTYLKRLRWRARIVGSFLTLILLWASWKQLHLIKIWIRIVLIILIIIQLSNIARQQWQHCEHLVRAASVALELVVRAQGLRRREVPIEKVVKMWMSRRSETWGRRWRRCSGRRRCSSRKIPRLSTSLSHNSGTGSHSWGFPVFNQLSLQREVYVKHSVLPLLGYS